MEARHPWRKNKRKFTRWRQCVFCSVRTRRGMVSYSRSWGVGKIWERVNIPSQPYWPYIYLSLQKVVLVVINIPLVRIVAVEESVTKKDAWDTLFLRNGREANATFVPVRYGTTLNDACYNCRNPGHITWKKSEAGCTGTCSLQVVHSFAKKQIQQNDPIKYNWVLLDTCSSANVLRNVFGLKNVQL